ncbi:MAG: hypothetical protein ACJA14_000817 [Ilumatobacter sp.]
MLAPSSIREPAHQSIPKEAEDGDIERLIGKYADAAERMQAGGMDGIELQSHGHLFDAWWSPGTNRRDDEWGGDTERRIRFPWLVLEAIRDRCGTDFINVAKGSIHNDVELTDLIPIHGMPSAPMLDFAGMVRAATNLPVLHAAKIDDVATARHAIREGKLDLVGMTRAQIADPHLVNKIIDGREREIRPCVGATYCLDRIYEAGEALCPHNAATSREATMPRKIEPADLFRRVVVVGAGPAGLEAARVADERGHDVIVLEAMPRAGGQINLAIRNPRRVDLNGIVEWRTNELARLGVEVRHNTFAEMEIVRALAPDAEIVTPEPMLGIEVGEMNHVPYARAFNETDKRITINQRVLKVQPALGRLCADIGSDHSAHRSMRHIDHIVVDHGTLRLDRLHFDLKARSSNRGAV